MWKLLGDDMIFSEKDDERYLGREETDGLLPKDSSQENSYPTSKLYDELFDSYTYASLSQDCKQELSKLIAPEKTVRFSDEEVRSLFEKRSSRKEARINADDLLRTSPDKIQFFNAAQARAFDNELQFALAQYLAQMEAAERNFADIRSTDTEKAQCYIKIVTCEHLRKLIALRQFNLKAKKLTDAEKDNLDSEYSNLVDSLNEESKFVNLKPAAIPSIFNFPPFIVKESKYVQDSDHVLKQLSLANGRRLCWVWNRCLIESIIPAAHEQLIVSTTIAAYVSWILYWFRGGVLAYGGLQHSFDMFVSEKEAVIEASKRRQAHRDERRDEILNDLVWGMANLACCFWLIGSELGIAGDAVTFVLLFMDLSLAYLRYEKAKEDYVKSTEKYNHNFEASFDELNRLHTLIQDTELNDIVISLNKARTEINTLASQNQKKCEEKRKEAAAILEEMINHLQKLSLQKDSTQEKSEAIESLEVLVSNLITQKRNKEASEERYNEKYKELLTDVYYSGLLLVAFGMMVFAAPAVSLAGAAMLGASTLLYRSARAEIEFAGIKKTIQDLEEDHNKLIYKFLSLKSTQDDATYDVDLIEDQMKQVYLDLLKQGAAFGYHHELLTFKHIEFARATFLRVVVPLAIGLTLAFAPATVLAVPTYVFLMLGVLVFAVLTAAAINATFKPEESKWIDAKGNKSGSPIFNQVEYASFKRYVKNNETNLSPIEILEKTQSSRLGNNNLFNKDSKQDEIERDVLKPHLGR